MAEHGRIVIEMNKAHRDVSGRVQWGTPTLALMIDQSGKAGTCDPEHKETTMLKTISAALIATSLIAAPALAANSGATTGTATQAQSQPTADAATPASKAKVTSTKSKKLHTSGKMSHRQTKKISLHKSHAKSHARLASKVSTKRG
jgi:hypothetical protein